MNFFLQVEDTPWDNGTIVGPIVNYLELCNPSTAPYHCNRHMLHMSRLAYNLYAAEFPHGKLDPKEALNLTYAALFHDFGHSGGRLPDSENIKIATEAAMRYVTMEKNNPDYTSHQYLDRELITRLIQVTEYPFIHEPQTLLEKCIRDADVLYSTLMGEPAIIMEDMRAEAQVRLGHEVSYEDMQKGQIAFISTVQLFLPFSQQLWDNHVDGFIDSILAYKG